MVVEGKSPRNGLGNAQRRKRARLWEVTGAAAAAAAATISVISNIGGARDTLCSLGPIKPACQKWNLISAPLDARTVSEQAPRNRLVQSLNGAWGPQNGSCANPITITTTAGPSGSRIVVKGANGYVSTGDIVTADTDSGVIFSRNSNATADGPRAQWEYHPHGDQLIVIDKDGVATTLVRCEAAVAAGKT
jgi:hypothetical protein